MRRAVDIFGDRGFAGPRIDAVTRFGIELARGRDRDSRPPSAPRSLEPRETPIAESLRSTLGLRFVQEQTSMAFNFNSAAVDIPCPKCGHKHSRTIGWIKTHTSLTCESSSCGSVMELDQGKFVDEIRKAEKLVDALPKKLTIKF